MLSVTANPLIGPVPIEYKITATKRVVIFASIIVLKAFANPFFIACWVSTLAFNSSDILAKIKTLASTAIPTVRTIPAIPGSVSVAPTRDIIAVTSTRFDIRAIFADKPNNLYLINIKIKTNINPTITEFKPLSIFSWPSVGPIVCSSTNFIGAASAPALSNSANSLASLLVDKPVILNDVPNAA